MCARLFEYRGVLPMSKHNAAIACSGASFIIDSSRVLCLNDTAKLLPCFLYGVIGNAMLKRTTILTVNQLCTTR